MAPKVNSTLRDQMMYEGPENFYMDGEAPFGHCPKCKRQFTSLADQRRHDEDLCKAWSPEELMRFSLRRIA